MDFVKSRNSCALHSLGTGVFLPTSYVRHTYMYVGHGFFGMTVHYSAQAFERTYVGTSKMSELSFFQWIQLRHPVNRPDKQSINLKLLPYSVFYYIN
jgi:hypothetical protein